MLTFSTKYYLALENGVGEDHVNTLAMKLEIILATKQTGGSSRNLRRTLRTDGNSFRKCT